jgi:tetratricopeptide (TPR) repeat protein
MVMKRALLSLSAAFGLTLGFCSQPREIRAADSQPRLEQSIRDDFMAGFRGDRAALDRAVAATQKVLDAQPANAEALVYLGSATLALSGRAFLEDHEMQKGMELWEKGNTMMDKAVQLQPDNIDVRSQRGNTLLVASRRVPPDWQPALLEKSLADFNRILELQQDKFSTLAERDRGELLMCLADGYDRCGDRDKSRAYLERIVKELPGTEYAKRAEAWLKDPSYPVEQRTCIGCQLAAR